MLDRQRPLAAILSNGGISFGGVLAFIFADLIILPILNIYRKYYGRRMSLFLLATFYAAMVTAGLLVDLIFSAIGLTRTARDAKIVEAHITLNYTTILNIIFLALAAALIWRFIRIGGLPMLREMNTPMADGHTQHGHAPAGGHG